jgi:hypothetical protein
MSAPQDFVEGSKEYKSCISRCEHSVYSPGGKRPNPMCSICITPLAARGLTKREVMDKALKTVGVRIKRVLKMKEEEEPIRVETPVEEDSETTDEGTSADTVEEVMEQEEIENA